MSLDRAWIEGTRHVCVSETDRHGKPLRTLLDLDTGLVRNDPVPDDAELARFYAQDYRTVYKGAVEPRPRQILRNFRRAAGHVRSFRDMLAPARRVLDVGGGSGEFAFLMQEMGKEVLGIEPNEGYATYCREALGLDMRTVHLAPDLFAPAQFDVIRLNHVLEHLNDPVGALRMISGWLAPGGLLQVEVPNIEAYAREKSRGNLFHYGHIYNFNPWTLRMTAALAGLGEEAQSAARCAGATSVFLRAGAPVPATLPTSPDNAARVRTAIARHYARSAPLRAAGKPLRKLARSLEETRTSRRIGTPREIGRAVARSI